MKVLGMICLLTGVAFGMADQEKFAHITQDTVQLDLSSGKIYFNSELVDSKALSVRAKKAYSIELNAFDRSGERGSGIDDLFGDAAESVNKGTPAVPAKWLVDVLEPIAAAGLEPGLVHIGMFMEPDSRKPITDRIIINTDGTVLLNGTIVLIRELSEKSLRGTFVSIQSVRQRGSVDFHHLLAVARTLGPNVKVASLAIQDLSQVQVEAEIYELNADGGRDVLTAPMLTTKPGNAAMIRVVENRSGLKNHQLEEDEFHQEDLANLGVRFSVKPVVIGEYIRMSGFVVIAKSTAPRQESFQIKGIPYYSYSVGKMVVPFSQILPPGVEVVEFKVSEKDNIKMMCRLSAVVVDNRGMSRRQREKARGAAPPPNKSIQINRPDSNVNWSVVK